MDLQFYGANCVSLTHKGTRMVIDDNLAELGGKSILKADDVALFTAVQHKKPQAVRLVLDTPGEYEVADISIVGISAKAHIDGDDSKKAIMFKLIIGETSFLFTGHVYPELSESQLEAIGIVDVLVVPVGGNGYTLDPVGALKIIKAIEPKLVVPTHYADKSLKYPVPQQDLANALKELAMEPKETVSKLRFKPSELTDVTQLIVLERL